MRKIHPDASLNSEHIQGRFLGETLVRKEVCQTCVGRRVRRETLVNWTHLGHTRRKKRFARGVSEGTEWKLRWDLDDSCRGEGSRPPPPPTPTPTPPPPHASLVQALLNELEMILLLITADFKRKSFSDCHSVCRCHRCRWADVRERPPLSLMVWFQNFLKWTSPPNRTQFEGACVRATCSRRGELHPKIHNLTLWI